MAMTSVRMPDELMAQLEQTAEQTQRSKGWIINHALEDYFEAEQLRLKRLAETREALNEIKAGKEVDGEAVLAWLDTWGTDDEGPAPGV